MALREVRRAGVAVAESLSPRPPLNRASAASPTRRWTAQVSSHLRREGGSSICGATASTRRCASKPCAQCFLGQERVLQHVQPPDVEAPLGRFIRSVRCPLQQGAGLVRTAAFIINNHCVHSLSQEVIEISAGISTGAERRPRCPGGCRGRRAGHTPAAFSGAPAGIVSRPSIFISGCSLRAPGPHRRCDFFSRARY